MTAEEQIRLLMRANQEVVRCIKPPSGIYATRERLRQGPWRAAGDTLGR